MRLALVLNASLSLQGHSGTFFNCQVCNVDFAKRRTWLMVKKDLERAGLQYKTKEGVADFHAAGRRTDITQLLRDGASLPEVKELARHTDV